jgi:hypothetical protein
VSLDNPSSQLLSRYVVTELYHLGLPVCLRHDSALIKPVSVISLAHH